MTDHLAAVIAAAQKVAQIKADLEDFDGDRRGHWAAYDAAMDTLHDAIPSDPALLGLTDHAAALAEALREIEEKAWGYDHLFESGFHAWAHEKATAALAAYEASAQTAPDHAANKHTERS